jgi:hypothetical protein
MKDEWETKPEMGCEPAGWLFPKDGGKDGFF